jgi:hypothetical protein
LGENEGAPKRNFFISYTGADLPWARWIASELEDAGRSGPHPILRLNRMSDMPSLGEAKWATLIGRA